MCIFTEQDAEESMIALCQKHHLSSDAFVSEIKVPVSVFEKNMQKPGPEPLSLSFLLLLLLLLQVLFFPDVFYCQSIQIQRSNFWSWKNMIGEKLLNHQSDQIIATSHDLGPENVAEEGKSPYFREI